MFIMFLLVLVLLDILNNFTFEYFKRREFAKKLQEGIELGCKADQCEGQGHLVLHRRDV